MATDRERLRFELAEFGGEVLTENARDGLIAQLGQSWSSVWHAALDARRRVEEEARFTTRALPVYNVQVCSRNREGGVMFANLLGGPLFVGAEIGMLADERWSWGSCLNERIDWPTSRIALDVDEVHAPGDAAAAAAPPPPRAPLSEADAETVANALARAVLALRPQQRDAFRIHILMPTVVTLRAGLADDDEPRAKEQSERTRAHFLVTLPRGENESARSFYRDLPRFWRGALPPRLASWADVDDPLRHHLRAPFCQKTLGGGAGRDEEEEEEEARNLSAQREVAKQWVYFPHFSFRVVPATDGGPRAPQRFAITLELTVHQWVNILYHHSEGLRPDKSWSIGTTLTIVADLFVNSLPENVLKREPLVLPDRAAGMAVPIPQRALPPRSPPRSPPRNRAGGGFTDGMLNGFDVPSARPPLAPYPDWPDSDEEEQADEDRHRPRSPMTPPPVASPLRRRLNRSFERRPEATVVRNLGDFSQRDVLVPEEREEEPARAVEVYRENENESAALIARAESASQQLSGVAFGRVARDILSAPASATAGSFSPLPCGFSMERAEAERDMLEQLVTSAATEQDMKAALLSLHEELAQYYSLYFAKVGSATVLTNDVCYMQSPYSLRALFLHRESEVEPQSVWKQRFHELTIIKDARWDPDPPGKRGPATPAVKVRKVALYSWLLSAIGNYSTHAWMPDAVVRAPGTLNTFIPQCAPLRKPVLSADGEAHLAELQGFIEQLLTNGGQDVLGGFFFLRHLQRKLNQPGAEVPATLLHGPPGSGKSWLTEVFARMHGAYGLRITSLEDIFGRFAPVRGMLLVVVDDVNPEKFSEIMGSPAFRALATDRGIVRIEVKGRQMRSADAAQRAHFALIMNGETPMAMPLADRRLFALKVSEHRKQDRLWFARMTEALGANRHALFWALLWWLKHEADFSPLRAAQVAGEHAKRAQTDASREAHREALKVADNAAAAQASGCSAQVIIGAAEEEFRRYGNAATSTCKLLGLNFKQEYALQSILRHFRLPCAWENPTPFAKAAMRAQQTTKELCEKIVAMPTATLTALFSARRWGDVVPGILRQTAAVCRHRCVLWNEDFVWHHVIYEATRQTLNVRMSGQKVETLNEIARLTGAKRVQLEVFYATLRPGEGVAQAPAFPYTAAGLAGFFFFPNALQSYQDAFCERAHVRREIFFPDGDELPALEEENDVSADMCAREMETTREAEAFDREVAAEKAQREAERARGISRPAEAPAPAGTD